jgi:hypothetical protein
LGNKPAKQDISKVENVVDVIRITWPKSTNAEGYKILRKANNGTWKTIKTIKDIAAVQYIDTETNNGVLYTVERRFLLPLYARFSSILK